MTAAIPMLIVHGAGTIYAVPLVGAKRWTIGRSQENEIILPDRWVSRHHARLELHPDQHIYLVDLGSRNGLFLKERQIAEPTRLHPGDSFTLGKTLLEFQEKYADPAANPQIDSQPLVLVMNAVTVQGELWRELLISQGINVVCESGSHLIRVLDHLAQTGSKLPDLLLLDVFGLQPQPEVELAKLRDRYPQLKILLTSSREYFIHFNRLEWAQQQGAIEMFPALPEAELAAYGSVISKRIQTILNLVKGGPLAELALNSALLALQSQFVDDSPSQLLQEFIQAAPESVSDEQSGDQETGTPDKTD